MSRNRQAVHQAAVKAEMTLGIYHDKIDDLHPRSLRRVLDVLDYGSTDVPVTIKGERYVVEIAHVDSEVDVMILPYTEYRNRYGRTWSEIGA